MPDTRTRCLFCDAELSAEEEVLERMCLKHINEFGTGWRQWAERMPRMVG